MKLDTSNLVWTRPPKSFALTPDTVTITTEPGTDLWQRTYYGFRNDNAPVAQLSTREEFFSFTVKTEFSSASHRFDQCGVALYLDSENWLKGSIEYENSDFCIECSDDGLHFRQLRICHLWEGAGEIRFGIYACSPENSSFTAVFSEMAVTECKWLPHDGQQPD